MLRRFSLFGHPVHPFATHLPLGLLLIVPLWDAVALLTQGETWWFLSFWTLLAGILAGGLAVLTGLLDTLALNEKQRAIPDLLRHVLCMGTALSVDFASLCIRGGASALADERLVAALSCSLFGAVILCLGGWYGGNLVYHHKVFTETDV